MCKTLRSTAKNAASRPDEATMNSALRMLAPATTRERSAGAARCWMKVLSGTMKKPLNTASRLRSATMRQLRPSARNSDRPNNAPGATISAVGTPARKRSKAKRLMPIEPSGTNPSSSLRSERRSHSSEPTAMPAQKSARKNVMTCSSVRSTSFV